MIKEEHRSIEVIAQIIESREIKGKGIRSIRESYKIVDSNILM